MIVTTTNALRFLPSELICSLERNAIFKRPVAITKGQPTLQKALKLATPANSFSRTRPKTYRAIVRELAEPNASVNGIARRYRVSNHTVMGIREREAKSIAERKKHLVSILADVATVGAERMSEKIGKASLRDAAIGAGVAVDKMVALTGQTPALQIANIVMPSEEERAELRAIDANGCDRT
jgi:transposase-like protein